MDTAPRVLGISLLGISALDVLIALTVLVPEERPLVLWSGLLGIVAGYVAFRNIKWWTIAASAASLASLLYGADIVTKKALTGEWAFLASSFSLPLSDPAISALAKVTFVWFQAMLPLFLGAVLVLCIYSWFRAFTRQMELRGEV
jgi:hypothetical protein